MKRNRNIPLWVQLLYALASFVQYKILDKLSSFLMWKGMALMDRYCTCHRCQERGWKPKQTCYCYECQPIRKDKQ